MRIRIYDIADDGSETLIGTFIGSELLEIGDSNFFSAALRVLAEEGEALTWLDDRTVLLRRVES
jgi:hypothetical protein